MAMRRIFRARDGSMMMMIIGAVHRLGAASKW
jgi:hypothetical protein